jgi:PAS domain-containing protein
VAGFVPVQLSDAFCSYCGRPPSAGSQEGSRVCVRCSLGMMLLAPSGHGPRVGDPFLIIDDSLIVRAISQRAELVLGVEEPEGVNALLDRFLRPANGSADFLDLTLLVQLAVAGTPFPDRLEFRTPDRSPRGFRAQVTTCGPPRAALLVLAALADRARPVASNGSTSHLTANQKAPARV